MQRESSGLPGGNRTPDRQLRRLMLYPTELRAAGTGCRATGRRWSGRKDSNLRPSGPKPDALPGCATPRLASILSVDLHKEAASAGLQCPACPLAANPICPGSRPETLFPRSSGRCHPTAAHPACWPLAAPVVRREIVALTRTANEASAGCAGFISHFRRVSGSA